MLLFQVESTDAFLECKKRFIDLGSVEAGLLILVYGVCSTFGPREINK
jgi:hypothetical protein